MCFLILSGLLISVNSPGLSKQYFNVTSKCDISIAKLDAILSAFVFKICPVHHGIMNIELVLILSQ